MSDNPIKSFTVEDFKKWREENPEILIDDIVKESGIEYHRMLDILYPLKQSPEMSMKEAGKLIQTMYKLTPLKIAADSTPRGSVALEAVKIVNGQRQNTYGAPEDTFEDIAKVWSWWKGVEFTAHDVAIMMSLMKTARIKNGVGHKDSYVDNIGYVALAYDIAEKGKN